MDPRRGSSDGTNNKAASSGRSGGSSSGLADTLTVSRVSRSPIQQQQQAAKTSSKSPMLGSHALMSPPLSRPPTGGGGTMGSSPPVVGPHISRQNGGLRSGSVGGGGSVSDQLNAVAAGLADYMVSFTCLILIGTGTAYR
jgi:hypothetical protein